MSKLDIVSISEVTDESPTIKTFYFDWGRDVTPGQFVMIWVPGVDEFPMALSKKRGKQAITVKKVGRGTTALHGMEVGEKIGIRGPYGKGYSIPEEYDELSVVIGGYSASSLLPAVREAVDKDIRVRCAMGAETEDELIFRDELTKITDLSISTDDGSMGHHGYVTEMAEDMLDGVDGALVCGPEVMMKKMVDMCLKEKIPVQASLERYIKCGLGLCGSCSIDGYQVCGDGPVFTGEQLAEMRDFGRYERDKTGKRIPIK